MSNDISYVIKVVDDFSANIKKFQAGLGGINQQATQSIQTFNEAQKSSKFFTQNLIDLGKAAGIYVGFQGIKNFGKSVFETRVQMDSLTASLSAIMPKFDKTQPAAKLAADEIEYLKNVTEKFGLSFQQALPNYMQFLASSKQDLATTRKTFEAFSGISRMYGLSAMRFGLVINALNQMQSKGVVSMEELRQQLGESLPGAIDLFAESLHLTSAEFMKFVGEGRIGAGALKLVAENIQKKHGKDMMEAAKTLGSETEKLSNSWFFFKETLSKSVAPAMTSTIIGLTQAIRSTQEFFAAIGDDTALSKLSGEMQVIAYGARIVADSFKAMGDAFSNMSKLGSGFWNLFKDIVHVGEAGIYQAIGVAEMAAGAISPVGGKQLKESGLNKFQAGGDVFQEILVKNQQRYFDKPQEIKVDVNLNNAPRGTTTEVKSKNTPNLKVGNVVNYETGMGGY